MEVEMSAAERAELAGAARGERRTRVWRRYRAVLLLAEGARPIGVATALGCSRASV
ncbi:MAG: helix-turn-helix domain-containing protein [Chloroflexota bacterium]|nr:helix-turn-helix domain-containing protein [Chloroflexota bacterium]